MKSIYPKQIPIFPLSGIIYFPRTNLPLNIFENRYLKLVNDCMKNNKLMGMIQSQKYENKLYNVGCLGKIIDFNKNSDGRILINLSGVTRFEIINEITNNKEYREFNVEYKKYEIDLNKISNDSADINLLNILVEKTKDFFKKNGLLLNWHEFKKLDVEQQVNTLSMIAPISNEEKQKLLETILIKDKIKTLSEILEFYLHDKNIDKFTIQ
tara:strand:+ start:307 stop:939 length:633 start_codon:yes stop_codon:yes gene_type:complete